MRRPNPHVDAMSQIERIVATKRGQPSKALSEITLQVLRYQRNVLMDWLMRVYAGIVPAGPFRGMQCVGMKLGHSLPPMLLGCYESELHDVLSLIARRVYDTVVDIGCGEGYYAVGLARLLPAARVYAFDIDPACRELCASMARTNACEGRVIIGGRCGFAELRRLSTKHTLVVCDCEGAELELLDPEHAPELSQCDILVECHEFLNEAIPQILTERFRSTHEVMRIPNTWVNPNAIPSLRGLRPIQKFLAVWEGRPGLTPWLFMTALDREAMGAHRGGP